MNIYSDDENDSEEDKSQPADAKIKPLRNRFAGLSDDDDEDNAAVVANTIKSSPA